MFSRVSLASRREGVNTTLHRAHFTHANICSRVAQGSSARFCFFVSALEWSFVILVCHFSCAVIVVCFPAFSSFTPRSHLCCIPSHSVEPCEPRTRGQSGRLAERCPLTGYEPNVTVEASSTEVTTMFIPARRASFCSAYTSGEDVTTVPVSSDVDERLGMGMLASPLLVQKRNVLSLLLRKFYVWLISHFRVFTHSPVARTFFCTLNVHILSAHIRTSSCVCTYTHGSSA